MTGTPCPACGGPTENTTPKTDRDALCGKCLKNVEALFPPGRQPPCRDAPPAPPRTEKYDDWTFNGYADLCDFLLQLGTEMGIEAGRRTRDLHMVHTIPPTEWLYEVRDHLRELLKAPPKTLPEGADSAVRRALKGFRL